MYDAQLGRWHVQDLIIQSASPYIGFINNPINYIDPTGMAVIAIAGGYKITGDDIIQFLYELESTKASDFWNSLENAAQAGRYECMMDGVVCTPNGNNLEYDRESGGEITTMNRESARDFYLKQNEEKKQHEYNAYMAEFYRNRENASLSVLKGMGLCLAPIAIAEAPAVISLKYAGYKLGASAISQKIINGKIDYADLIADGFLTPGAGSIAKVFNITYDAKQGFLLSTPESVQKALLISGSSYLFGTANSSLGNIGTKHLGNNAAANGIFQGVVSFQTNTLENIATNLGD